MRWEADFETFWRAYPRKKGTSKPLAKRAFEKALQVATFAEIMRGLAAFPFNSEPHLQPHAATFLNQARYQVHDDTPAPSVVLPSSRSSWRNRYDCPDTSVPFHSFPEARTARLDQPDFFATTIEGHLTDD
jgi:hypothetical protein